MPLDANTNKVAIRGSIGLFAAGGIPYSLLSTDSLLRAACVTVTAVTVVTVTVTVYISWLRHSLWMHPFLTLWDPCASLHPTISISVVSIFCVFVFLLSFCCLLVCLVFF